MKYVHTYALKKTKICGIICIYYFIKDVFKSIINNYRNKKFFLFYFSFSFDNEAVLYWIYSQSPKLKKK